MKAITALRASLLLYIEGGKGFVQQEILVIGAAHVEIRLTTMVSTGGYKYRQ